MINIITAVWLLGADVGKLRLASRIGGDGLSHHNLTGRHLGDLGSWATGVDHDLDVPARNVDRLRVNRVVGVVTAVEQGHRLAVLGLERVDAVTGVEVEHDVADEAGLATDAEVDTQFAVLVDRHADIGGAMHHGDDRLVVAVPLKSELDHRVRIDAERVTRTDAHQRGVIDGHTT